MFKPEPEKEAIRFENLLPRTATTPEQMAFRARLLEILKSQGEILPAADRPLGRLWKLVNSEESSIDQCVSIIALDPALTSRVFRLANSASYEGKAATLAEAVIFLGMAEIRQAAFSARIFEQFSKLKLPEGWNHFWVRNVFISRLAERIAAAYFPPTGMEYLAGLLHDIGWIFLATFFPVEMKQLLASDKPLPEAELETLSFTHADIAALLCARSRLPNRVISAVNYHQNPMVDRAEKIDSLRDSAKFLGVLLNVCAKLADCREMQMFGEEVTIKDVAATPEALWLTRYGAIDFEAAIEEELPKSQELCAVFFADHPHTS